MAEDDPYSRTEVISSGDNWPERGPFCEKCKNHIPQFADLPLLQENELKEMIQTGKPMEAMMKLMERTGCSHLWAKIWCLHSHEPNSPDEKPITCCPYCGNPLRTATAKQCRHCKHDWHDQENITFLK